MYPPGRRKAILVDATSCVPPNGNESHLGGAQGVVHFASVSRLRESGTIVFPLLREAASMGWAALGTGAADGFDPFTYVCRCSPAY